MLALASALRPALRRGPPARAHHYLVLISDFPGALEKRLAARPAHLAHAAALRESGVMLAGAAQLTRDGAQMTGSCFIFDLPSEEAVWDTLRSDPYVKGGAWDVERAEVRRIKVARLGTLKEEQ